MSEHPPDLAAGASSPETGTVRWFDAQKQFGVINRADGSTIFIPPNGLAEGQGALAAGQRVAFLIGQNPKGPHAAEVRALDNLPPQPGDVAAQIAAALGESKPAALAQIRRLVQHQGPAAALAFVDEALRVEAAGGMRLPDGSRRRTLGGVFFVLVKNALSAAERDRIFPPSQRFQRKARPSGAVPSPPPEPPPPFHWADRISLLAPLLSDAGKATTVKVTIIGRPSQIAEQPQFTLLTLTHAASLSALPRGIPTPDQAPATTYSVYIGKKQWRLVAEALQNPEDVLIVEGTQLLDSATGTIAVFATKTTTKLLQQASRQSKPAEG